MSNDDFPSDAELAELLADSFSAAADVLREKVRAVDSVPGTPGIGQAAE